MPKDDITDQATEICNSFALPEIEFVRPETARRAGDGSLDPLDGQHETLLCPCGKPMISSTGGWTCSDEFTAWALREPVGMHDANGEVRPIRVLNKPGSDN